jgi:hypothetical protein
MTVLAGLFVLPGCTKTLQVQQIEPAKSRNGIGYVLPFTQYNVTATWRLSYCPDPAKPDADGGKLPKISLKVEAAAGSADDGTLAFMINPQDLQSFTSVTAFTAKWQDGRNLLSSINVSVEDRSVQIAGNVVKAAVKLLPLLAGAPGAARPAGVMECSRAAAEALPVAAKAKALVDTRSAAVEAGTADVKRLTAKVATMGASVDKGSRDALGNAIDALVDAQAALTDATEKLTAALRPISYVYKFQWPDRGDTFSYGPAQLPDQVRSGWLTPQAFAVVKPRPLYLQIERSGTFGRVPEVKDLTADPVLETRGPILTSAGDTASYRLPDSTDRGLRYRMPAAGRLVACWRSPCGFADTEAVIASFDGPIAQLGFVNVLPFSTRAFGTNSFSAEFAGDGSLKTVSYEQKAAPGEGLTGALAEAATQFATVLDPTARLESQTAYLKALKERSDALDALKVEAVDPAVSEKSGLDTDTALINARIANLQAHIALEELRARQPQ